MGKPRMMHNLYLFQVKKIGVVKDVRKTDYSEILEKKKTNKQKLQCSLTLHNSSEIT